MPRAALAEKTLMTPMTNLVRFRPHLCEVFARFVPFMSPAEQKLRLCGTPSKGDPELIKKERNRFHSCIDGINPLPHENLTQPRL